MKTTTNQLSFLGRAPSPALAAPPAKAPDSTTPTPPTPSSDLTALLHARFHLDAFRPHQEEVCHAVTGGQDALLVMPTGSGKSLCYQLPGLARGGTTLVISPLIALMDDQTEALDRMGLRALQIHSGRTREQSREACHAYLEGRLDFLAIAPERLAVPGFPEMLARRRPTLIAVDEAHCISHWGHDFRPDYRLLGERLPSLLPAPILALTATATVRVQDDICRQLGIPDAVRFIRGFRRDNLAIEMVERPPSARQTETEAILADRDRRPAIVYVPTRRLAEDFAARLARHYPAAPYHAGLDAAERARTQTAFRDGDIEVVVATIAFGMGIDKADVRTVVHLALPGSVEAYYQEIGRAGRDGRTARAILFYSWGDRKIHETFFERNFPTVHTLHAIVRRIPDDGIAREALIEDSGIDPETAENAIAKLWIHGGIRLDAADRVTSGTKAWEASYTEIRAHREAQLEQLLDLARGDQCRMTRLIRHFGDRDSRPCGHCDACAPQACLARQFRPPTRTERAGMDAIMGMLRHRNGLATGTLYRSVFPDERVPRDHFERLVDAMAQARLLILSDDRFENDEGRQITFRRAYLCAQGARLDSVDDTEIRIEDQPTSVSPKRKTAAKASPRVKRRPAEPTTARPDREIMDRIKAWRLELAREEGIPAFRILTDKAVRAIAASVPKTPAELLKIAGVGPHFVGRWGRDLLLVLQRDTYRKR